LHFVRGNFNHGRQKHQDVPPMIFPAAMEKMVGLPASHVINIHFPFVATNMS